MLRPLSLLTLTAILLGALTGCGGSEPDHVHSTDAVREPGAPELSPTAGTESLPFLPDEQDPPPETVVAHVNDTEIKARSVYEVVATNKMRLQTQGGILSDEIEQHLRAASLQLLIDGELMIQAAKKHGLAVEPKEVDDEVQHARSQFATEDDFRKYLADAKITEGDVRKEAERRLLMQAYQRKVTSAVQVRDAEVRKFYEENKELFKEGDQVRVAQILIRSSPNDSSSKREAARKRAEEAYRRAVGGEDFANLARELSQADNAGHGGEIPFFPRGVTVPKFEEMCFNTAVDKITPVFETPYGFNVVKVLGRKEPRIRDYEEVKTALMLDLSRRRESEALQADLEQLRAAAKISILDTSFEMPAPEPAAETEGEG